jgi:putative protease
LTKLELLSPAKDLETGIAAILHGADAVYIGAPKFSARAAAGNSIDDIKKLVEFAHQYFARVYVALNTILKDNELAEIEQLINELYAVGVDALIIQDMGILELDLPPIELHASTQCDNRTWEKVDFLEKCGFSQAILARELSLNQIAEIRQKTDKIRLECFVQGALCVCYSGQCYASQAVKGRSANRGECAQICRLPYSLVDSSGAKIAENQHLLSLKDFSAADFLEKMIDAGVTSFKIEGRLKNIDYVKNITAFYRQKIDEIINKRHCGESRNLLQKFEIAGQARNDEYVLAKTSSGKTKIFFTPDIQKTFFRGATSYFLENRKKDIAQFFTPKSTGQPIGKVTLFNINNLVIKTDEKINNGDGLCAFDQNNELVGFRVNRVEGNMIFPQNMPKIEKGAMIYRNFDIKFSKELENKSSERKIEVKFFLNENESGVLFKIIDENNCIAEEILETDLVPAQNPEKSTETIFNTLKKLGDTIFEVADIQLNFSQNWFLPASKIAQTRRMLIEKLIAEREEFYRINRICKINKINNSVNPENLVYPVKSIDYRANVSNSLAKKFYEKCGVTEIAPAYELSAPADAEIMRTKHCLKFSFNLCPKQTHDRQFAEPFYLINSKNRFQLKFDCKNCEMAVLLAEN